MDSLSTGLRLVAALMLLVAMSAQGEVYKWVDESGQVHYSQTPPPKGGQVERLDLKTKTPTSEPSTQAAGQESAMPDCGSITLPRKMASPVARIAQLKEAVAVWQKYLDENSDSTDKAVQQRMEDRRCAIDYAKGELQSLSEVAEKLEENYQRVSEELEELQAQLEACNEPQREEGGPSVAECRSQYNERISALKKMKRTLEASNKSLKQGE